jgi:sugar phosphate isomerase/epimerase
LLQDKHKVPAAFLPNPQSLALVERNMRLAFSSNAYLKYPFDQTAERIAALGYEGLELLADVPHAWPAGLLAESKKAILAAMDRYQLKFSNMNAFMMNAVADHRQPYWHPSFIEPDPAYRKVRIDHTRRALSLCAELGAPHITTEPGGPLAPGQSRQEAVTMFVEALKPLAEHAGNLGVMLLIEPEPGLLVETTDQYLEVADRLGSESVGLNFDIGHAYCVSEDLPQVIKRLARHIRHYHVEDIAATRVHHHLVPGDGAIDFGAVFEAIRATGYNGWLTVELYPYVDNPDDAARRARDFLRPLITQASTPPGGL